MGEICNKIISRDLEDNMRLRILDVVVFLKFYECWFLAGILWMGKFVVVHADWLMLKRLGILIENYFIWCEFYRIKCLMW